MEYNNNNQNENEGSKNKNIMNKYKRRKIKQKKIYCIEFPNNTQIFINYESNLIIKYLIKTIIEHKKFIEFYPNKNYFFNSSKNLILFDIHLCIYRQIKPDYENKISFDIKIDNLYSKEFNSRFSISIFFLKIIEPPFTFPYSPNKIKMI